MPVLYRGIAFNEQTGHADSAAIRTPGSLAAGTWWQNTMASPTEVRLRTSEWAQTPSEVRDEISQLAQVPLTYAFGDFEGAARYAGRASGIPVVMPPAEPARTIHFHADMLTP
jgi:hypothetical protein